MDIPRHDFTRRFELMETRWHPICTDKAERPSRSLSLFLSLSRSLISSLSLLSLSLVTCLALYQLSGRFQTRFTTRHQCRCIKRLHVSFSLSKIHDKVHEHMRINRGKPRTSAQSVSAANSVKARKSMSAITAGKQTITVKFSVTVSERLNHHRVSSKRTFFKRKL